MTGVTASQTYYPRNLIYSEEAFARVLPRRKKNDHCAFCCKSSKDLKPCSECSDVKYCGKECQEKDSTDHKTECANMCKLPGDVADVIRMLGRVIFKIKGKDWKTITRKVMGTDVSFDDIDPHYEEMTKNPRLVLLYKRTKEALKDFIGEENMPEDDDLIKIIGKVKFSSGSFSSDSPDMFCFGMDQFQHECIPNSNLEPFGNFIKVWAIKKIEASEKISISYRHILTTDPVRAPINDDSLEICSCTECSLPYGESVLTKIIDERKAYAVIRLTEKILRTTEVLSNLDLEHDIRLRVLVDDILQSHEGVLGHTNALHLKLLAIKALTLEGTDIQRKVYLMELEKHMSSVFGDYYLEMNKIYNALVLINYKLGNFLETALYLKQSEKMKILQPENE